MERLADMIVIVTLGILSWQDFRSRQIAWWLLPLLAAGLFLAAFDKNSTRDIGIRFSLNITFLCIQFLFVWIWFSLKQKKPSKLIDTQIGLGDVLFMICIALAFSPANFILFYTTAMIATLVVVLVVKLVRANSKSEIPLAGALSIPLIVLCAWRIFDPSANFYNDEWLSRVLLDNL
jgi:Flp pilus assembly protein protease CpaA